MGLKKIGSDMTVICTIHLFGKIVECLLCVKTSSWACWGHSKNLSLSFKTAQVPREKKKKHTNHLITETELIRQLSHQPVKTVAMNRIFVAHWDICAPQMAEGQSPRVVGLKCQQRWPEAALFSMSGDSVSS